MGHDRGARVGFRLALDAPERVERLVLIDIIATPDIARLREEGFKFGMLHGVFLSQPAPLPESLIIQNPADWVESRFRRATLAKSPDAIHPVALADYIHMLSQGDRVHATCEDYRSEHRADQALDENDRIAGAAHPMPPPRRMGDRGLARGDCGSAFGVGTLVYAPLRWPDRERALHSRGEPGGAARTVPPVPACRGGVMMAELPDLFPGFETHFIEVPGAGIFARVGRQRPAAAAAARLSADPCLLAQGGAGTGASFHARHSRPARLWRQPRHRGRQRLRRPTSPTPSAPWPPTLSR